MPLLLSSLLPDVIHTLFYSYLPCTSFINLSVINKHWRMISTRTRSQFGGTFDFSEMGSLSNKYLYEDHLKWFRRLSPYQPISLNLGYDMYMNGEVAKEIHGMASSLRSLTIGEIADPSVVKWLSCLTSLSVSIWSYPRDGMTTLASLSLLTHYRQINKRGRFDEMPRATAIWPSSLTMLELPNSTLTGRQLHYLLKQSPGLYHLEAHLGASMQFEVVMTTLKIYYMNMFNRYYIQPH
jgi:hypothetical protein